MVSGTQAVLSRGTGQFRSLIARPLHPSQNRLRIELRLVLPPTFIVPDQIGLGTRRAHSTRRKAGKCDQGSSKADHGQFTPLIDNL